MYWPDDYQYYPCMICAHRPKHGKDPGHRYELHYDEGEAEIIDLANEGFRLIGGINKKKKNVRLLSNDAGNGEDGEPAGNKWTSVAQ